MIDSYGLGGFRLNGEIHLGNLLVCENQSQKWLVSTDIVSFLKNFDHVDLLIFGTGKVIKYDENHLMELKMSLSIGIECLATPSACRLYNMLVSEGRNLAAAIKNI